MPASLDPATLARWRLASVGLAGRPTGSAGEAVKSLLASQSQDYRIALWSLAQRSAGLAERDVESEHSEGVFLRTHVLRPTWHFVHRDDLRLLLTLTAPRVHTSNGTYYRREEVDTKTLAKCHRLIAESLADGNHLTRGELGSHFSRNGVEATRFRLAYILMHAELEQVVCSGRPQGKAATYALFDERVPPGAPMDRDELLGELVFRYFSSHGPATVKDLRWWSSLTISDIRRGLEVVARRLDSEVVDDRTFWFTNPPPEGPISSPTVHLLQAYDEYVVGFQDTRGVIDAAGLERGLGGTQGLALSPLFVNGQIAGRWKRTARPGSVRIDVQLHRSLDSSERAALADQASEYGRYVGMEAELVTSGG